MKELFQIIHKKEFQLLKIDKNLSIKRKYLCELFNLIVFQENNNKFNYLNDCFVAVRLLHHRNINCTYKLQTANCKHAHFHILRCLIVFLFDIEIRI